MTTFTALPADIAPPADDGHLPGDADAIADLAQRFRSEAETLRSASDDLGASDTSGHWQGQAGQACQSAVQRSAGRLDQLAGAYDECAAALAQWAESLRGAQDDARRASSDIDEARERLRVAEAELERQTPDDGVAFAGGGPVPVASSGAQTMPDDVESPDDARSLPAEIPDADGTRAEWQQKADEARADLEAARQRLDDAAAARDDAASAAASKIQEAEPRQQVVAMGAATA